MTTILCEACTDRPAHPGTWLCTDCTDQLHGDLPAATEWWQELEIERCRQSRKGQRNGGRGADTALPYSPEASAAQTALRSALQELALRCGLPAGGTVHHLARVLQANEPTIPATYGVGVGVYHLRAACEHAARLCGLPPEKRYYLGPCATCGQAMRTAKPRGWHRCCDQVYDIEETYASTLARVHDPDNSLTLMEAAALTGEKPATLRKRIQRGNIKPVVGEGRGAWYRFGDLTETG